MLLQIAIIQFIYVSIQKSNIMVNIMKNYIDGENSMQN